MEAAGPGVLVSENTAGVLTPKIVAFTLYGPPALELAVTVAEAKPEASVTAVTAAAMPGTVPDGPLKVTVMPGNGWLAESVTKATNWLNELLTAPVWLLPALTATDVATAAEIVRLSVELAACCGLLVSRTVALKLVVPALVGVPVMMPALLIVRPAGNPVAVQL